LSTLLEVEDLVVDIPVPSGILHPVREISFHVDYGETLCIVGESGCGKSLTSLAIMGLLPNAASRNAKQLNLEGESLLEIPESALADLRGDKLSMIFQDPMTSLNPSYSIGNQLGEVLMRHRGATRAAARDRAVYLLEKVGISSAASRLGQYPHQLSGGLRQRVMIAMALMCEPRLLIADEPTTALDVTIQAQILLLIRSVQKEFNIGVILITHDLGVVARVADRVAVMYSGQIVETGTAIEVFEKPLHPYTQGLIDCIPIPGKTKPGEQLGSIPGIVPTLVGDLSGCTFRDRCDFAQNECADDVGENVLGAGRQFRCILPAELGSRKELVAVQ
jgi:peptide/nickel transport system ATP-binding protein|tara:strand:- start:4675 stop:5676 length:1002 start_codon:yes stop_codon:yes gene_type:complete